jgi:hypothetical protein
MSQQFPSMPLGEIFLRKGSRELVASGNVISIGEQVFQLDAVDRVVYHSATRINQASYTIGLAQGAQKCRFMVDAYRRGSEFKDMSDSWSRLVTLLEATACRRIAQDATHVINSGGTFFFGSLPANRIDANAEGLRFRRIFSKRVPWDQITSADLRKGEVQVWTSTNRAVSVSADPKMSIAMSGWNAVVLPRVVSMLAKAF